MSQTQKPDHVTSDHHRADGMTEFVRFLRAVDVASYTPPPVDCDGDTGHTATLNGQEYLRQELEAGNVPKIVLVAPERGTVHDTVESVYAWTRDPTHTHFDHYVRACSVRLVIESDHWLPDQVSDEYADGGSCLILTGTIVRVEAVAWLEPVFDQIAELTGVAVERYGRDSWPVVAPGKPVTGNVELPLELCAALRNVVDTSPEADKTPSGPTRAAAPIDDWYVDFYRQIVDTLSQALQMPYDRVTLHVLRYDTGDQHEWHTDRAMALGSTFSFSLLLNDSDEYDGGELEFRDLGPLSLRVADFAAFTAATEHHVRPVTSGRRYALVGFAEVDA